MKYILLFFIAVFISCKPTPNTELAKPSLEKATVVSYRNVDVQTFKQSTESDNAVIIDVRTPEEVSEGKIDEALTLNFYDKDFAERLLALDKEEEYYLYCKKGGRSAKAARLMIQNGFKNVNNLEGGYTAWKKDEE